jgi:ABC-2 type transport system ATP-binding protein
MKKKLALACTLVHEPDIVFLDEPSTGVDPVSRGEFWSILSQILAQGVTVVLTTPYLDEAARCDRVGLLHAGRFMTIGRPSEIAESLPGAVFTVATDRPRDAYAELRKRWPSSNVVLVGDDIRFWSFKGREDVEAAAELLRGGSHEGVVIREASPTLDDAFVALLSDLAGDSGAAAPETQSGGASSGPRRGGPDAPGGAGRGDGRKG